MQEQIIAMISEIKDDAQLANRLNEHSSIMEDGGLDSLQLITFLLKVEERFDIEIDFEQFDFDFFRVGYNLLQLYLGAAEDGICMNDRHKGVRELMDKRKVTILCSGFGLGFYIPGLLAASGFKKKGYRDGSARVRKLFGARQKGSYCRQQEGLPQ
ncbi:acyl carrier protein [Paenibacillus rhizoplanae]